MTGRTHPFVIALLLCGMSGCVPWTVRPIDGGDASEGASTVTMNSAAFVDSIWNSKLMPAISNSAVDARTLLDAIAKSPEGAEVRYGHREANGPAYFVVKGEGRVMGVDTRSRLGLAMADIAPFDGQPDISIQIGPVLRGSSLRDATGIVRFTDFLNQLQFADAGNELNERVLNTVLKRLDRAELQGRTISFVGTLAAEKKAVPPLRELIPVKLNVASNGEAHR